MEAPRIPDRDQLVTALSDDGFDARPVNDLGIEVAGDGDVFADVEAWIANSGIPLVPQSFDGTIFLHPPAS